MKLTNPEKTTTELVQFLSKIFKQNKKKSGIIAVSGGVDSAVSLTLLTKALGPQNVFPVLLPYKRQSIEDSELVCSWNKIPKKNWQIVNIEPFVQVAMAILPGLAEDRMRLGNVMARSRMIVVYDLAKALNALVCGTENRSEEFLGYFTRFGDEASDIEPIQSLYKTQVWEIARHLGLPEVFVTKAPSAGLWQDQTDEKELGYSYADADMVLGALLDDQGGRRYLQLIEGNRLSLVQIELESELPQLSAEVIKKVLQQVISQQFKHEVPYTL